MGLFDKVVQAGKSVASSAGNAAVNVGSSAVNATKEQSELMGLKSEVNVIELAVKPQDFLDLERNRESNRIIRRRIQEELLNSSSVREAYLLWYPLIAACSYIRTNKKDPFAAEYIVPQLLLTTLTMTS